MYVPAVNPEIVLLEPVPEILPGLITQFPVGNPLNITLPVAVPHVGLVIVPTTGVTGITFGAATPEPEELVQPSKARVTEYVPATETVMEAVVALLLHKIVPPTGIDKVEVPQLFTTVTTGVST